MYNYVGYLYNKNVGLERELFSSYFLVCLYVGVKIGGCNRENGLF